MGTISHDLNRWWHKVRGKEDPYLRIGETNDRSTKGTSEYVWALQDINFEVQQGEVLGIIGKNGAGKSTLLKILSKITSPTTGSIKAKGRIASLLEVGTGFHPELTGRENIYLNGTILGMTKREVTAKLDEIVDFSGVERYLDTPVKRYSSGMMVRLGFAVAAHLEPEILIVDEVLAVGDAEFQKKAVGKMQEVSKEGGRTVLFVSHNLGIVSQLCTKGLLLKNGKVEFNDSIQSIIDSYLSPDESSSSIVSNSELKNGISFSEAFMCDYQGNQCSEFRFDEPICMKISLFLPVANSSLELALRLVNRNRSAIFTIHEKLEPFYQQGEKFIKFQLTIPAEFITPNHYSWVMCINHPGNTLYDLKEDVLSFSILETGSEFSRYKSDDYGSVFAKYEIKQV